MKIGESPESVVAITTEQAISIIEATVFEQPHKVSASYDAIYQCVKNSLFQNIKDSKVDKSLREALDKISAMLKENIVSHDYLKDLVKVIEMDGLSGHSLRFNNKLTKKDFAMLPDEIEQRYINKMIDTAGEIEMGGEVLILSEEIL